MPCRFMPMCVCAVLAASLIVVTGPVFSDAAVDSDPRSRKEPMSQQPQPTAGADDAFARALFAKLAVQDGNVVVSPASVEACVLMALAGARGSTASQMALALQLPDAKEADIARLLDRDASRTSRAGPGTEAPASKLVIANSAWVQQGFPIHDAYRKLLETDGRATLESVDFSAHTEAARQAINAWVDGRTEHKIKELLAPGSLDRSARLVLANAIYFKGAWARPFYKEATRPQPYLRPGQPQISVPLMHLASRFRYLETDRYQAVELPYEKSDVSMVVWLPRKAEALAELERELCSSSIGVALKKLATANVELFLPKFKIQNTTSLAGPLTDLGMKDAFSPAADFSGISNQSLSISAVVHQALVNVDEVGTEAAAATALVAVASARPALTEQKIFRADHPFLFAICNPTSGEILFVGRVVTPGE